MTCTALFTTTAKAENKGSDEKETIKFTYWGSGDEKKAIEESVDKFMEANPNIEVDLMHIPSEDFLTKLNAMIAAGEAPDVSYSASWKCQMGEDGLIYNFYDLLDDMGLSKDDYLLVELESYRISRTCSGQCYNKSDVQCRLLRRGRGRSAAD